MARIRIGAPAAASLVVASIVLSAAASGGASPEGAGAPQLAAGDHWEYRVRTTWRGAISRLEVGVVSVTGGPAPLHFERADANSRSERLDEVDRDGNLVSGALFREPPRAFAPPAQLLAFPLDKGKTSRQTIDTVRKDTGLKDQILIYGKVGAPAAVSVPAGRYVRIKREAKYNQTDRSHPEVRTESTVPDLMAFRPGRGA